MIVSLWSDHKIHIRCHCMYVCIYDLHEKPCLDHWKKDYSCFVATKVIVILWSDHSICIRYHCMYVCLCDFHEKPWLDHGRKNCNYVITMNVIVRLCLDHNIHMSWTIPLGLGPLYVWHVLYLETHKAFCLRIYV